MKDFLKQMKKLKKNNNQNFIGNIFKTDEIHLTPGTYKFTFESQLPAELPTSTEGCNGYIRYQMLVVFDIPIWPNKVFDTPFTVIKPVILENMPKLHVISFSMQNFIQILL